MSYRKRHVKNKIKKIKPKKSILKSPVFWLAVLFLAIVALVFYVLFFCPEFFVKNILVSGNEKINSEQIKNLVAENMPRKIFSFGRWSLVSGSIFFADTKNMEKKALTGFPRIESLSILKKYPQTLEVQIKERRPVAVFCQNECFFIDGNGIIFAPLETPFLTGFIVRQTPEQKESYVGEQAVQKNIMQELAKIEKNLKDNFNINISEALISSPLRLDVRTSENWQIYFDLNSDMNLQLVKLNSLLKNEISQNAREKLEYIDLRFKDRAYYQ